ncbi:MAG TPA: DNA topoisomerase (ATP-hydrolyzing) subunit B [Candidatus Kapabacteria bacterium]|nr:DNA topoisomerase (ATP-hydrolyzing) subunit B [Candidatus Kapabacteria bacterium]HPP39540.1 DNA topoisomerase (ATP-hydrolyzing) subunit B [Candidatus Kapabacteria bacterium]
MNNFQETELENKNSNAQYTEESIRVLEGLEAVRQRPAMYIGDISERGLHHLINEVVDNSIDEALAGFCKNIIVTLHSDGACSVEDDGRGIPTGIHPEKNISTLELVMCTLHAGGKFDNNTYKVSGGLHGVGVSCVNALSTKLIATVKREGKIFQQIYEKGIPATNIEIIGETNSTGTTIKFYPDPSIFQTVTFKFERVADRLRELAFLNPEVKIIIVDEREDIREEYQYKGGLKDFVSYIDSTNTPIIKQVYIYGKNDNPNVEVEICFQYNASYSETLLSYVNNIHTIEGGTHVSGFRSALTRTLNEYAKNNKQNKFELTGEDFREGLTAIVSVKVSNPMFEGQTKTKLGNAEVEGIVRSIVNEKLGEYLDSHPSEAKKIIEKANSAAEARIAARKSRELVRRKNSLENSTLPGKLADCSLNSPEDTELFIVEGDSAGGSAKQGRDRRFQAILPLKGKILNVIKATPHKILENDEIKTIIAAIGAGFSHKPNSEENGSSNGNGNGKEKDFDVTKARYGKIILMADADVDGSHIRTLLLTFFFTYMRDLINKGMLYIAQPPLYKIKKGKLEYYANNEEERDSIIQRLMKDSPNSKIQTSEEQEETNEGNEEVKLKGGIVVSRFKGLGEMNPEQLWETTMNPEKRTLLRVNIEDAEKAALIFQTLMGDKVEPRREFIERNAQYVKNLDI